MEPPYLKIVPDAGLIETPLEQRKGNLELRFSSVEEQTVAFTLENRSEQDIECDVVFMQSSFLFGLDSFSRENPTDNAWNYTPHWNIHPPPQDYEMSRVACCIEHGTSAISRDVQLCGGTYSPFVYSVVPWNTPRFETASVTITADNKLLVGNENMPDLDEPRWAWVQGNDFAVDETKTLKIEVTGRPVGGLPKSYANLGYLAFVDENLLPPSVRDKDIYPEWPGKVIVPAHDSLCWEKKIEHQEGRVDVWVFERNSDQGKAYHIFRLLSADTTMGK